MAERRMFAKTIIDSDMFLDMPLSAQALYFHLSMRADDDGFLNNSQKIIRMINASKNDYDMLLIKQFIIQFDDGICVIKHWRIHNYIRNDRYKPTMYQEQAKCLTINSNKSYSIVVENETGRHAVENESIKNNDEVNKKSSPIVDGIPVVNQMDTQDRLGKDRLDKNRTGKGSKENKSGEYKITTDKCSSKNSSYKSKDSDNKEKKSEVLTKDKEICEQEKFCIDKKHSDYYEGNKEENNSSYMLNSGGKRNIKGNSMDKNNNKSAADNILSDKELTDIMQKWNSLNVSRIITLKNNRLNALNARIDEYGIDKIFEAIGNIDKSSFLKGNNKRGWRITFDWFLKPFNFNKVLEGNYEDSVNDKSVKSKSDNEKIKFNNFDGRNYDYNLLEKKLLGWDKD